MNETARQLSVIKRNTVEIIEERELAAKIERSLAGNRPLRVKYGIDPTSPEIHVGHTVPIKKLRDFQMLGHTVLFLIGDFTARIGDPTGRKETRPILSTEEIQTNLAHYKEQAGKILDLDKTQFVYNSAWLSTLTLEETYKIMSVFTIAQILERDDFTVRYREQKPIFFHEFIYPLLQGYDSVALEADVEIGATEQKFNLLAGRTLQEAYGQEKQIVVTMPILVGTDGKMKMSKSYGNHIPVDATPDDMFGKIMSIPDSVMEEYFAFLTERPAAEFKKAVAENPRAAKADLAREIVAGYFGGEIAGKAEETFDSVFREKRSPSDIPEVKVTAEMREQDGTIAILRLIAAAGATTSNSEARRLILQKAVDIDGAPCTDPQAKVAVKNGQVVRVGKRKFFKVKVE